MRDTFRYYVSLSKLNIMLPVSLTGFTGYFIFDPHLSVDALTVTAGIFLLAVAASVLNQVQEAGTDQKMERTRLRPIPAGKISKVSARLYSFTLLVSGSGLLLLGGNSAAMCAGLFAVIWYNGVYTIAKRITAFAVFPGAVTGAMPPIIGWTAAGGSPFDKTILLVGFLLFLGQIPHFWLIILRYGEEYRKAGLPSLTEMMSVKQIRRLIFTWIAASAIASVFLFLFGVLKTWLTGSLILVSAVLVVWFSRSILDPGNENYFRNRMALNSWFLLIMILLITDSLLRVRIC